MAAFPLDVPRGGWVGIRENEVSRLLVGHDEDPIPAGGRLVEEIFLAALPVGARGSLRGPFVQNCLECLLGFFPLARPVEITAPQEKLQASAEFVGGAVDAWFADAANELIDGNRLKLANYADKIQLAKEEPAVADSGVSGFVDENVCAVVFVECFEARGKIHSITEGGVAIAQRGAHVADAGHAGVEADADVQMRLAFGLPFFLHLPYAVHHF